MGSVWLHLNKAGKKSSHQLRANHYTFLEYLARLLNESRKKEWRRGSYTACLGYLPILTRKLFPWKPFMLIEGLHNLSGNTRFGQMKKVIIAPDAYRDVRVWSNYRELGARYLTTNIEMLAKLLYSLCKEGIGMWTQPIRHSVLDLSIRSKPLTLQMLDHPSLIHVVVVWWSASSSPLIRSMSSVVNTILTSLGSECFTHQIFHDFPGITHTHT